MASRNCGRQGLGPLSSTSPWNPSSLVARRSSFVVRRSSFLYLIFPCSRTEGKRTSWRLAIDLTNPQNSPVLRLFLLPYLVDTKYQSSSSCSESRYCYVILIHDGSLSAMLVIRRALCCSCTCMRAVLKSDLSSVRSVCPYLLSILWKFCFGISLPLCDTRT